MTATLTTPITVLDQILAINLNITLWSARTKLTAEDFSGIELPPDELASLGCKKICDPAKLAVFTKLKSRAFTLLDRHGVRFLSGWAIPEDKAGDIIKSLCEIRDEFLSAKAEFLSSYDDTIDQWVNAHPNWTNLISGSTVSREYVDSRMSFAWQLYRVAPAAGIVDENAMEESGLSDEIEGLGNTLFSEITKDADEIWKKVFEGKTEVTHKALSPLKTMRDKLSGLTFIAPHVLPVVELIETALMKMPKKGYITGAPLLMVQGLVSILKDRSALLAQVEAMMVSHSPQDDLSDFFAGFIPPTPILALDDIPNRESASHPLYPVGHIDSMGLW